mgnify:CR=1 FL=1
MKWNFVPFEPEHGKQICSWRYPAPYTVYNWKPWETMLEHAEEFADPAIRQAQYEAVVDENGDLCGFAQFFPLSGWTRIGLGMRPDLCGKGLGASFALAVAHRALARSPGTPVDLEVTVWNERAIRAYLRAGFAVTDTYVRKTPTGQDEFHCMVFKPENRNA